MWESEQLPTWGSMPGASKYGKYPPLCGIGAKNHIDGRRQGDTWTDGRRQGQGQGSNVGRTAAACMHICGPCQRLLENVSAVSPLLSPFFPSFLPLPLVSCEPCQRISKNRTGVSCVLPPFPRWTHAARRFPALKNASRDNGAYSVPWDGLQGPSQPFCRTADRYSRTRLQGLTRGFLWHLWPLWFILAILQDCRGFPAFLVHCYIFITI